MWIVEEKRASVHQLLETQAWPCELDFHFKAGGTAVRWVGRASSGLLWPARVCLSDRCAGGEHGFEPHGPTPGRAPAALSSRWGSLCFQAFLGSGFSGWLLLKNYWYFSLFFFFFFCAKAASRKFIGCYLDFAQRCQHLSVYFEMKSGRKQEKRVASGLYVS